jgi:phage gpG-like protein
VSVTGTGTVELEELSKQLKDLQLKQRMLSAAAAEARTQVMLGFQAERDPDGIPWKPLQRRKGKILRDTARMSNSFTARPTTTGFMVGNNVEYTKYHQKGTKTQTGDVRIPVRRMVPPSGQLSQPWTDAIDKACTLVLARHLKVRTGK